MLKSDDNYIPVDDAMQRFEDHLLSHDRVVLSAKLGDGKTCKHPTPILAV